MKIILKGKRVVAAHDDWQIIPPDMYPGCTISITRAALQPGSIYSSEQQGADYVLHQQDLNLDPTYLTTRL